jgi:S1-C subfamily serine protease
MALPQDETNFGIGTLAIRPVVTRRIPRHVSAMQQQAGDQVMTDANALAAFSDHISQLVERVAPCVVAVHGGRRWSASGMHWRSGVIVTAEEALDRDDDITLTLPGGREVDASLAGRDPTTDVAVLRFQPDGLPIMPVADAALRSGQLALAVGNQDGAALAALGIVALAGGPWHSRRGGSIDSLIRLDLSLHPAGEGGALVDPLGQVTGMAVLGPRRRALAIPSSTINRSVDQLLAKGHVFRGYLGAGLRPVRGRPHADAQSSGNGVLVVSIDPNGPSARAGLLVGDIIVAWNAEPLDRVRQVMRLLGPESAGSTVDLSLLRGGVPTSLKIVLGERPVN